MTLSLLTLQEQYIVLHEALVEAFQWKQTAIPMDKFPSAWKEMERDSRPLNQQKLRQEYAVYILYIYEFNFQISYK